jgi:hypothetical protein
MAIEGLPSTVGNYMPDQNNLSTQVDAGNAAVDVSGVVVLDSAMESQASAGVLARVRQLSQVIDKFDDYPMHVYNSEQLESMTSSLQNLGSLGTDQMGTDTLAFLKIFQEMAKEMKAAAREMRTAELTAQISALNSAADQMKVAADARLAAGIVQSVAGIAAGAVQVAGGAVQIGASVGSAGGALKSAKMEQQAGTAGLAADVYQAKGDTGSMKINREIQIDLSANAKIAGSNSATMSAVGQASGQIGGGLSGITTSMGGLGATVATRIADAADEQKTLLETDAKVHETAVQHANDVMQQMQQIIYDVMEKLSAMMQASVETTRGIARNV